MGSKRPDPICKGFPAPIVIEITPKAIREHRLGVPTRTCFASHVWYSNGSRSEGQIDLKQVKALFAEITEELKVLAEETEG